MRTSPSGDDGDDVVIGGCPRRDRCVPGVVTRTGAGVSDVSDRILGDGGPDGEVGADLLAGDNATPVRRADGTYDITLWDVATTTFAAPSTTDGNDTLYGGDVALTPVRTATGSSGRAATTRSPAAATTTTSRATTAPTIFSADAGDDDLVGGSSSTLGQPPPRDA